MKNIASGLIAAAALAVVGIGHTALAADMPIKAPPLAPPAFSWTGIYGGFSVGGYQENFTNSWPVTDNAFLAGTSLNSTASSLVFGGQIGYLYQFSNLVVGLEASYLNFNGNPQNVLASPSQLTFGPGIGTDTAGGINSHVRNAWLLTPRLGWAWNRWMGYVKGGWAVADVSTNSFQICCGSAATNPFTNPSLTSGAVGHPNGWVAGGGIDYAITNNLILGLEYQHLAIDSAMYFTPHVLGPAVAGAAFPFNTSTVMSGYVDMLMFRANVKL